MSEVSEKAQSRTWSKKLDKKYGKTASIDMIDRDPFIPAALEEKLRKSLPHQMAIIPNELARKNNVRVSTIKVLLRSLEADNQIKIVNTSSRLRVYTGVLASEKGKTQEVSEESTPATPVQAVEAGEEVKSEKKTKGGKGKKGGKAAKTGESKEAAE